MEWERGNLLKKYTDAKAIYSYNSQGIRFQKEVGEEKEITTYFLDGGKLLAERKGDRRLRFTYDQDGILGVQLIYQDIEHYGEGGLYHYVKDGSGNVVALMDSGDAVALYEYDTWGKCKVLNPDGTENKDSKFIGNINPIRWKSQYYDTESGFYYIDGRYYSPEIRRYISAENPERAMTNAGTLYGLNLYLLCLTNPVGMVYNGYTIETNAEMSYDAPKLNAWGQFVCWWSGLWKSKYGKGVAIGIWITATLIAVFCPPFRLFYWGAVVGIGISLGVGAGIAGFRSLSQGNGYWEGFANYIKDNWAQEVSISFALAMVTFGVSQAVAAIKVAKANKALANAAEAARDAKVAELRKTLSNKNLKEVATVVGGYNKTTGQVAVGVKKFDRLPYCAEALVVEQLGGMKSIDDIVMTAAIRPSNLNVIPVCEYCQSIYSVKNFLPGTPFKPL